MFREVPALPSGPDGCLYATNPLLSRCSYPYLLAIGLSGQDDGTFVFVCYGYIVGEFVLVDLRLKFRWKTRPDLWRINFYALIELPYYRLDPLPIGCTDLIDLGGWAFDPLLVFIYLGYIPGVTRANSGRGDARIFCRYLLFALQYIHTLAPCSQCCFVSACSSGHDDCWVNYPSNFVLVDLKQPWLLMVIHKLYYNPRTPTSCSRC